MIFELNYKKNRILNAVRGNVFKIFLQTLTDENYFMQNIKNNKV